MAAIINIEEYDEHGHKKKNKRDMSDFQVLKRIVGFLQERRYRKFLISFFIVVIVGSVVGFLFPYLFNRLVTDGLNGGISGGFDRDAFYFWGKILILCMFISFFVWISQQYIIFYLANNIMYQMRKRLFKNLQRLSFDYFDDANRSSGKIISYLTNDVETIHQLISAGLLNVVAHILNLVGSLILMFYTSVTLSLISFAVISIVVLTGVPFLLKARQYFIIMRRKVAEVTGNLQESISGSRLIKAFAYEEQDQKRFRKSIEEELKINLKVQKLFAAMPGIMISVMGGGLGLILLVSAKLMESGGVNGIGDIFQFFLFIIKFFWLVL
jgi:ABC-type multidrug transport system fused ATPase/permease subunit